MTTKLLFDGFILLKIKQSSRNLVSSHPAVTPVHPYDLPELAYYEKIAPHLNEPQYTGPVLIVV